MTGYHFGKRFCKLTRNLSYAILAFVSFFFFARQAKSADLFSFQTIKVEGWILSVMPADLDEDGSAEIVVLSKTGSYPHEKRWISVYRTEPGVQCSESAHQRWEVDPAATMFEVGDIASSPGKEIFYLTDSGISYYPQNENGDFNGDGRMDLFVARDGKIEIFLNGLNGDLFSRPYTQSGVVTSPFMHICDLNSDGADDLLFYQKKRNGKISILLNSDDWKKLGGPDQNFRSEGDR